MDKSTDNIDMKISPLHVMDEDWDNLLILDACRFDAFKNNHDRYIHGRLEKRRSLGSCTLEWLKQNFKEQYEITYISSNPYINSLGKSFEDFNANDHFTKIIDVWNSGWDDTYGTVPPSELNKAYAKHYTGGKVIIHYLQPHYPFLQLKEGVNGRFISRDICLQQDDKKDRKLSDFRDILGFQIERILGQSTIWSLRGLIELEPTSKWEWYWNNYGKKKLYELYIDNLSRALKSVRRILKILDGKTYITSDHGEAFGEKNVWGHPPKSNLPVLREVPWFEVEY